MIIRSSLLVPEKAFLLQRKTLLKEIEKGFSAETKDIKTVVISGIAGSGKTTLARLFALSQNSPVIWEIRASNEDNICKSFQELAQGLSTSLEDIKKLEVINNLSDFTIRKQHLLSFISKRLKQQGEWLLIFDNAISTDFILKNIPLQSLIWGTGKILITTQNKNIAEHTFFAPEKVVHIGSLSLDEQMTLYNKIYGPFDTKRELDASDFLKKIPPYPLDVSLAASYLKQTGGFVEDYLKNHFEFSNHFFNLQKEIANKSLNYPKNRFDLSKKTIDSILKIHPDFKDLLILISLIDRKNIPYELLALYQKNAVVDYFIHTLKKFSFIHQGTNIGDTFTVHKSLSEICFLYLKERYSIDASEIDLITTALVSYIRKGHAERNKKIISLSSQHAKSFLKKNITKDPVIKARLFFALGRIESDIENYTKATEYFEKAYPFLQKYHGEMLKKTLKTLRSSAHNYIRSFQYQKALCILQKLYPKYVIKYGKDHAKSLAVQIDLGRTHGFLGNYKKSFSILHRIFHLQKKEGRIGKWSGPRLVRVMIECGLIVEAQKLLQEDMKTMKYISIHKPFIEGLKARVLFNQKLYKAARQKLEKSVLEEESFFGKGNARTFHNKIWLAKTYIEENQYTEAEKKLIECLSLFNENNLQKALIFQLFGRLELKRKKLKEAEKYLLKSIVLFKKVEHSDEYWSHEMLSDLKAQERLLALQSNKAELAEFCLKRILQHLNSSIMILNQYFPENSPHISRIQSKIKKYNPGYSFKKINS